MIEQACTLLGYDLVISTPGIEDKSDIAGFGVPDFERGITRMLPLEKINLLINATRPTVWFSDDLGNAELDTQAGYKGKITRGGEICRNPNIIACAATNRPQDKTGVRALHESLRSEFPTAYDMPTPTLNESTNEGTLLCTWRELRESWREWAYDNNVAPIIIAWHDFTEGRTLYTWKPSSNPAVRFGDFRAWHAVARKWNAGMQSLAQVGSTVGKPIASEFLQFAALQGQIPTMATIRVSPQSAQIPDDKAAMFLVVNSIARAAEKTDIAPVVTYMDRLANLKNAQGVRSHRQFAALLAGDLLRGKLGMELSGSREWGRWYAANHDLFETGE